MSSAEEREQISRRAAPVLRRDLERLRAALEKQLQKGGPGSGNHGHGGGEGGPGNPGGSTSGGGGSSGNSSTSESASKVRLIGTASPRHMARVRQAIDALPPKAMEVAGYPTIVHTDKPLARGAIGNHQREDGQSIIRISEKAGLNTTYVFNHELTHVIAAQNPKEFLSVGAAFDADLPKVKAVDAHFLRHYMESPSEAIAQSGAMLLGKRVKNAPEFRRAFPKTLKVVSEAFERLGILPAPLVKGGPGSGNFGHAGRPGEVGGSAADGGGKGASGGSGGSTAEHSAAGGSTTGAGSYENLGRSIPRDSFAKAVTAKGLRVKNAAYLQKDALKELSFKDATDIPEATVDGITAAVDRITKNDQEFADYVKENVVFIPGNYSPAATATSVSWGDEAAQKVRHAILINTSTEALSAMSASKGEVFGTPQMYAHSEKDTWARKVYEGSVVHELGHVFNKMTGGGLDNLVMDALILSGVARMDTPANKKAFISYISKISKYAAAGGPSELAAEVYASHMLGLPLPKELSPVQDRLRARTK